MWLLLVPLGLGLAYWGYTTASVSRAIPTAKPTEPTDRKLTDEQSAAAQAAGGAGPVGPPIVYTNTTDGVTASKSDA